MASSDLFSSHPLPFSVAEPKALGEQFVQPWCAHRRAFRLALFPMGPDSSPASPLSMQPTVNTTYQLLVHQPSTNKARNNRRHLISRVEFANIVPTGKFTNISVKMFAAHLVIGTFMRTLEH